MLHYLKRELESHFVHIFSNASVPVSGSVKNIVHYWVMYGILAVGEVFFFKAPANDWPKKYYYGMTALWAVFTISNLTLGLRVHELQVPYDTEKSEGRQ